MKLCNECANYLDQQINMFTLGHGKYSEYGTQCLEKSNCFHNFLKYLYKRFHPERLFMTTDMTTIDKQTGKVTLSKKHRKKI
jgi:hypothetical protein